MGGQKTCEQTTIQFVQLDWGWLTANTWQLPISYIHYSVLAMDKGTWGKQGAQSIVPRFKIGEEYYMKKS